MCTWTGLVIFFSVYCTVFFHIYHIDTGIHCIYLGESCTYPVVLFYTHCCRPPLNVRVKLQGACTQAQILILNTNRLRVPRAFLATNINFRHGFQAGCCTLLSFLLSRQVKYLVFWKTFLLFVAGVLFICFNIDHRILYSELTEQVITDGFQFYTTFFNAPPAIKVPNF